MFVKAVIIAVCIIVLALIATGIIAGSYMSFRRLDFGKHLKRTPDPSEEERHKHIADCAREMRGRVDQEYFITAGDGIKLHGSLIRGNPDSDVYVLCSHGYRYPHGGFELAEKAPIWSERGYHLFFIDHRAHAGSEGRFISFGQHESEDGIAWLEFMKKEFGEHIRIILHGQSMGSTTILLMSGKKTLPDNVKLIVADCGYIDFYSQCESASPLPSFLNKIPLLAANIYLRLLCHVDMRKSDALEAVRRADVPILFIHGERDALVPARMCGRLYEACASRDREMLIIPGATHVMSYAFDAEKYTRAACEFADRHLSD